MKWQKADQARENSLRFSTLAQSSPPQDRCRGLGDHFYAASRAALLAGCAIALIPAQKLAAEPSPSLSWGYNSYGTAGLIDMPSAHSQPDGELGLSLSHFAKQSRYSLSFQVSNRLSASFRYGILHDIRPQPGQSVWDERLDRSFSLHYRLVDETRFIPALAVGINDLIGNGIYGGEYLVASKTLSPRLRASIGLGWGRLGTYGGFDNPLGSLSKKFEDRPRIRDPNGGTPQPKTWFRGDAALFAGMEWQATDQIRVVAEYSSDDYEREDRAAFNRRSPVNLGFDWGFRPNTVISARYLYGSELGLQLTHKINPGQSRRSATLTEPQTVRPAGATAASWENISAASFQKTLRNSLSYEGLIVDGIQVEGPILRVQLRNTRYDLTPEAIGRAARVLANAAPAEVEAFDIRLSRNGMPVTSVMLPRSVIEGLDSNPDAVVQLKASALLTDAQKSLPAADGSWPIFNYAIEPTITPSFFDPDSPLRTDLGLALSARYEPKPGLVLSARLSQRLIGNLAEGNRPSTSVMPHVRSDSYLYYKGSNTRIQELTASWYFRPAHNFYARLSAGYFEMMHAGLSAELLWKRQDSRFAFGLEVNHTKQRDYEGGLGFLTVDDVTSGHVSAYYQSKTGYDAQLDIGRYLAKDIGATLRLGRTFDTGWRIGVFATKTDVSAEDFGEGSFDKGIELTVPISWASGRPDQRRTSLTLRPVLRDGGAKLIVPGRLYETIHDLHRQQIDRNWPSIKF